MRTNKEKAVERGRLCVWSLVGSKDKLNQSKILGRNYVFTFTYFFGIWLMGNTGGWMDEELSGAGERGLQCDSIRVLFLSHKRHKHGHLHPEFRILQQRTGE